MKAGSDTGPVQAGDLQDAIAVMSEESRFQSSLNDQEFSFPLVLLRNLRFVVIWITCSCRELDSRWVLEKFLGLSCGSPPNSVKAE